MTACRDSQLDFHEPLHEAAAVALCHTCPRVAQCALDGATEPYGVWGATTPRDRGFPTRRAPRTRITTRDLIAPHLTRRWVHVRELAEWISRSRDTTEQTLRRMEADGIVEHYRGGYWRLR